MTISVIDIDIEEKNPEKTNKKKKKKISMPRPHNEWMDGKSFTMNLYIE